MPRSNLLHPWLRPRLLKANGGASLPWLKLGKSPDFTNVLQVCGSDFSTHEIGLGPSARSLEIFWGLPYNDSIKDNFSNKEDQDGNLSPYH